MSKLVHIAALCSVLAIPPTTNAGDCDGDTGYSLTITPSVARLGDPIEIDLTAPPSDSVLLLVSASQGSIPTQLGTLCLGAPLIAILPMAMPASGQLGVPTYMHCEAAMVGQTFYTQFVSFSTDGMLAAR